MGRRRGLGVLTQTEPKQAILEISHQLIDIDGELARTPRVGRISGGATSGTVVTVAHDLNKIPDDVYIVPDANITWYVTEGNRKVWTDKIIELTLSGACQFSGHVISY